MWSSTIRPYWCNTCHVNPRIRNVLLKPVVVTHKEHLSCTCTTYCNCYGEERCCNPHTQTVDQPSDEEETRNWWHGRKRLIWWRPKCVCRSEIYREWVYWSRWRMGPDVACYHQVKYLVASSIYPSFRLTD